MSYPSFTQADFHQGMKDRITMSDGKYGPLSRESTREVDALRSCAQRIRLYEQTGNTEWLMDAANYLMIEFMWPKEHAQPFFRATSSNESPGRTQLDGVVKKELT